MIPMTPREIIDRICAERGLRNTRADDGGSDQHAVRERKTPMTKRLLLDSALIMRDADRRTAEVWGNQ
ncbi:MAG: hypothetical protein BWK73_37850 [Thiothrix lacustris]|uniref:Uncharacterized protein n=1 Tax=Thiothrix lacustris TaxID=525917 RepID=A0A1Y1QES6_9GAMM|nr:MAG: hypothetical protein BWK73_37850 [Thiothrix lacustris]